jgi:hypothetical protein
MAGWLTSTYIKMLQRHPRLTIASIVYPFFMLIGLGVAWLGHFPWWGGLLLAFAAMVIVGLTAG